MLSFMILIIGVILLGIYTYLADYRDLTENQKPTKTGKTAIICLVVGLFVSVYSISEEVKEAKAANLTTQDILNNMKKINEDSNIILNQFKKEARRISPSDFQLRIMFSIEGNAIDEGPEKIHIDGTLGESICFFELEDVKAPRTGYGRGGSPGHTDKRYIARDIAFGNFKDVEYLDDLKGKIFKFNIALLKYKIQKPVYGIYVDLYIKGRLLKGTVDDKHNVTITFDDLE